MERLAACPVDLIRDDARRVRSAADHVWCAIFNGRSKLIRAFEIRVERVDGNSIEELIAAEHNGAEQSVEQSESAVLAVQLSEGAVHGVAVGLVGCRSLDLLFQKIVFMVIGL